jgi:hypothetical protein
MGLLPSLSASVGLEFEQFAYFVIVIAYPLLRAKELAAASHQFHDAVTLGPP